MVAAVKSKYFHLGEILKRIEKDVSFWDSSENTHFARSQMRKAIGGEGLRRDAARKEFDLLSEQVKDPRILVYLVASTEFYDDQLAALNLLRRQVDSLNGLPFNFQPAQFYACQSESFTRRNMNKTPHHPSFLEYALSGFVEEALLEDRIVIDRPYKTGKNILPEDQEDELIEGGLLGERKGIHLLDQNQVGLFGSQDVYPPLR